MRWGIGSAFSQGCEPLSLAASRSAHTLRMRYLMHEVFSAVSGVLAPARGVSKEVSSVFIAIAKIPSVRVMGADLALAIGG